MSVVSLCCPTELAKADRGVRSHQKQRRCHDASLCSLANLEDGSIADLPIRPVVAERLQPPI